MRGIAYLRRELSVRGQEMALANKLLHEPTAGETPRVILGRNESRHGSLLTEHLRKPGMQNRRGFSRRENLF
jgi:hypothetical protein